MNSYDEPFGLEDLEGAENQPIKYKISDEFKNFRKLNQKGFLRILLKSDKYGSFLIYQLTNLSLVIFIFNYY